MSFIIIYTTNKNFEEAKKIANYLLENKLIACANFFPISSSYLWKGKIKNSSEVVSILKTREENFEKIKQEIKSLHSYETPCIIKIDVEANEEFEKWVKEETD